MRVITITIFIFCFLLLRPYQLQQFGLKYAGDDDSYFAHATSLVYGDFPSYKKEYYFVGKNMPMHAVGPGDLAAPFVFVFSLLDRVANAPIVHARHLSNIIHSWSLFGFVFASSFYLWMACLCLYKAGAYFYNKKIASLSVILLVLFQGVPLFAFRRPVYSHIYELFLSFLLFLIAYKYQREQKEQYVARWWFSAVVGIASGFVCLVRYNNALFTILWPLVILGIEKNHIALFKHWKEILISYAAGFVLVCFFAFYPMIYNHYHGYGGVNTLIKLYSFQFYLARIFHIIFDVDWGLLYTAPFLLLGLFSLIKLKLPLKKQLLFLLIPCFVDIYIAIMWKTQGGWYGYRYFLFSLAPVIFIPFTQCIDKISGSIKKPYFICFILLISIFPVLSMLCFEGSSDALTLHLLPHDGWNNLTYQLSVWKTVLFSPKQFSISILKGGPLYLVYCVAVLLGKIHLLPSVVLARYKYFSVKVFIQVYILYLSPFVFYALYKAIYSKKVIQK